MTLEADFSRDTNRKKIFNGGGRMRKYQNRNGGRYKNLKG